MCTPFHVNQEDNANQLVRLKTGIMVNPFKNFTRETLLTAVGRVIVDRTYSENAKRMKSILKRYDGIHSASTEIIRFCNKRLL